METTDLIQGIVFSVEEFAVNDGPGIRTTIFLKGCPLRCEWCHNPEGISPKPQILDKKGKKEMCGKVMTVGELADMVLKNAGILAMNDGGITLTGGEPLAQPEFVIGLLKKVKPFVHTAVETSGHVPGEVFKSALEYLDLVLFDIKHMDPVSHKRHTGVDNRLIQENLRTLIVSGREFVIRVPLIPGVNDTEENMRAMADTLKGARSLKRVELLRYNKMAGAKYGMVGREFTPSFDTGMEPRIYKGVFEENNIKAIVV